MVRHWNRAAGARRRHRRAARRGAAQPGHQRRRRRADRARAGHRDDHEVHPRRLPRAHRHADPLRDHAGDQHATTSGSPRSSSPTTSWCRCRAATTRSCWSPRCTTRRCARWRTPGRPARTTSPRSRSRSTRRSRGRCRSEWERRDLPVPLTVHRLAVPRDHPAGPRLRPRHPPVEPARRRHRLHPGVRRRPLVGAAAAQPERAAAQDPAAVPARRHGHQRALPAALVRAAQGRRRRRRRARRRAPADRDDPMTEQVPDAPADSAGRAAPRPAVADAARPGRSVLELDGRRRSPPAGPASPAPPTAGWSSSGTRCRASGCAPS